MYRLCFVLVTFMRFFLKIELDLTLDLLSETHFQRGVRLRNCVCSFSVNNSHSHVHLDHLFLDVKLRLLPCKFAFKSRIDQILNQLNHNRQIAWLPFHIQIHKFIRSLSVKSSETHFRRGFKLQLRLCLWNANDPLLDVRREILFLELKYCLLPCKFCSLNV